MNFDEYQALKRQVAMSRTGDPAILTDADVKARLRMVEVWLAMGNGWKGTGEKLEQFQIRRAVEKAVKP